MCSGMNSWHVKRCKKTKDMALLSFDLNFFHGVLIGKKEKVLLTPTVRKLLHIYIVCVRACVRVCLCVFFSVACLCVYVYVFVMARSQCVWHHC